MYNLYENLQEKLIILDKNFLSNIINLIYKNIDNIYI